MMMKTAVQGVVLSGILALAACTRDVTAPAARSGERTSALIGGCGGDQTALSVRSLGASWGGVLPTVTVTANFSAFSGVPAWLRQSMNFPRTTDAELIPCLNDGAVTYSLDDVAAAVFTPTDPPDGVDTDFWARLSEREKRVLVKQAELLMKMNPGRWTSVGQVINDMFKVRLDEIKVRAKIRAMDFYRTAKEQEQFAGAVYGCMLFRSFSSDPDWVLHRDETLGFTTELVAALGEALFVTSPSRGAQFGRNGVIGASLAFNDSSRDCGWLTFEQVIPDRVKVTDPATGGNASGPGQGRPDTYIEF